MTVQYKKRSNSCVVCWVMAVGTSPEEEDTLVATVREDGVLSMPMTPTGAAAKVKH